MFEGNTYVNKFYICWTQASSFTFFSYSLYVLYIYRNYRTQQRNTYIKSYFQSLRCKKNNKIHRVMIYIYIISRPISTLVDCPNLNLFLFKTAHKLIGILWKQMLLHSINRFSCFSLTDSPYSITLCIACGQIWNIYFLCFGRRNLTKQIYPTCCCPYSM